VKKQQKFVLIIAAIVVTLAWMAVGGVQQSATYYVTLDELLAMENPGTKRIRVGGDVADGTIDIYISTSGGASAIFGPGTVIPAAAQTVLEELNRRLRAS